jgi:hypothetical protein
MSATIIEAPPLPQVQHAKLLQYNLANLLQKNMASGTIYAQFARLQRILKQCCSHRPCTI